MRVDTLSDEWDISLRNMWAFQRGTLWTVDLNAIRTLPAPRTSTAARFAQISDSTRNQLFDTVSQMDPISPQALKRRFDHGSQCYGAWVDDLLVSYGWLTYGPEWVGEFERNLQIPGGDAYVWDCATLPNYRRMGLFRSLLGFIVRDLLHEDVARLWIISVLNAPAIVRGISDAGFRPVAHLTYLRLINLRGLLMRPSPYVSSALIETARQVVIHENDMTYGPTIFSLSTNTKPPDTHV